MRGDDEDHRFHHEVCRCGPHHQSPEANVCGGEASAVPRFYRGRPDGGRGERGIFLIIRDHGERESIAYRSVRWDFSPKELLLGRPEDFLTSPPGRR